MKNTDWTWSGDGSSIVLILAVLGLALLLACGTGCAGFARGFTGAGDLTIVNNSTHDVEIIYNAGYGSTKLEFGYPDGNKSALLRPMADTSVLLSRRTTILTVKFFDHGHYVGTARYRAVGQSYGYYDNSYRRDPEALSIEDRHINGGEFEIGRGWFAWGQRP